jgi:hypothetical protein
MIAPHIHPKRACSKGTSLRPSQLSDGFWIFMPSKIAKIAATALGFFAVILTGLFGIS